MEIQAVQDDAVGARIDEGDVAKLESLADRSRRGQRIRLRLDRRLHLQKREQVGKE